MESSPTTKTGELDLRLSIDLQCTVREIDPIRRDLNLTGANHHIIPLLHSLGRTVASEFLLGSLTMTRGTHNLQNSPPVNLGLSKFSVLNRTTRNRSRVDRSQAPH